MRQQTVCVIYESTQNRISVLSRESSSIITHKGHVSIDVSVRVWCSDLNAHKYKCVSKVFYISIYNELVMND